MMHRSPARFLAPLALLACIGALFLIVTGTSEDASDERDAAAPAATQTTGTSTTDTKSDGTRRRGRRFYTVKTGDTPSGIAEETGVPLSTLLELNPDVDPQALAPGVRLRLRK